MEPGEEVIRKGKDIRVPAQTDVGTSLGKLAATIELNHYEREIQYVPLPTWDSALPTLTAPGSTPSGIRSPPHPPFDDTALVSQP
jgi:hypothetical protein